jgi:hypothetical protein
MPHPAIPVAVRHPEAGSFVTLDPAVDYDPSDVLVTTYPWAFAKRETGSGVVESVPVPVVEQATAAPGEKRSRKRAR